MLSGPDRDQTTTLLLRLAQDPKSPRELLEAVYGELRSLADAYLRRERSDHTLQPTALVHEAYLRLIDQTRVDWRNRAHFVGVAAQAMRRILVDHARAVGADKRGGHFERVELDAELAPDETTDVNLVALDRALTKLGELSERRARIVELRFFGGMDVESVAALMDISTATVTREWRFARAWLTEELRGQA